MIRELKSKLKQRFLIEDQVLEEPTCTEIEPVPQHRVPVGTVEAKKQAMNEKLKLCFAAKQTQTNVNGSLIPNKGSFFSKANFVLALIWKSINHRWR